MKPRTLRLLTVGAVALLTVRCSGVPETAVEPARGELRIVVVSDLNSAYGSTSYEDRVSTAVDLIADRWQPDLVLAAGDMVGGQKPELSDALVRAMWESFDSVVGFPLRNAGIPFVPTIGNHDGSRYPAHARDRAIARSHWRDPEKTPRVAYVDSVDFPFNYTFLQRDLFVLVWDASNEEIARLPGLLEWVQESLASPEARGASMRIVLGHLPLYAVAEGRNRPGEVLAAPDSLRTLLEDHDVQTYISGHHHAYYPGRRGDLDLLYSGALGQGQRPLIGSESPSPPTITVMDLWPAADSIAYTTYRFDEPGADPRLVERRTLPREIDGFNGRITRMDVR